jgi:hypothetical protein
MGEKDKRRDASKGTEAIAPFLSPYFIDFWKHTNANILKIHE